jgi:hypothetical protein
VYIIKAGYERIPFISRDKASKLINSCGTSLVSGGYVSGRYKKDVYIIAFAKNLLPTPTMAVNARAIAVPALVDYYNYAYGQIWSNTRAVAESDLDALLEVARAMKDRCRYKFGARGDNYVWYTILE